MSGYIEYIDSSILSPMYPHALEIGGNTYSSANNAIQSGEDPREVLLLHVRNNRDIYYKYRNYTFSGTYSDLLNDAIRALFVPKKEVTDIGRYIYVLDTTDAQKAKILPREYSIRVIRPVYITSKVSGNIHIQQGILPATEEYNVFLIENIPLYVGRMGSFFLLNDREKDISLSLQKLRM